MCVWVFVPAYTDWCIYFLYFFFVIKNLVKLPQTFSVNVYRTSLHSVICVIMTELSLRGYLAKNKTKNDECASIGLQSYLIKKLNVDTWMNMRGRKLLGETDIFEAINSDVGLKENCLVCNNRRETLVEIFKFKT